MIEMSPLITGIITYIGTDTYLAAQLGNRITYGIVPQQNSSVQNNIPYMSIYDIATQEMGSFGGTFLDKVVLQFSVWTSTFANTSLIITELGNLLNNAQPTFSFVSSKLVQIKRSSSAKIIVPGQNSAQKILYQGMISFDVICSGC